MLRFFLLTTSHRAMSAPEQQPSQVSGQVKSAQGALYQVRASLLPPSVSPPHMIPLQPRPLPPADPSLHLQAVGALPGTAESWTTQGAELAKEGQDEVEAARERQANEAAAERVEGKVQSCV